MSESIQIRVAKAMLPIFNDHGMPISCPDDCDMDDLDRERWDALVAAAGAAIEAVAANLDKWQRLDAEAATHVESVICMRTGFTGEAPYVGWKGLGLALNEALDDRDRLATTLRCVINAWETLPGGRDYPVREIGNWLCGPMKAAIDRARAEIAGKP